MAKIYGQYDLSVQFWPENALPVLTGLPTRVFKKGEAVLSDQSLLKSKLMEYVQAGYIMTAQSYSARQGLEECHNYVVMKYIEWDEFLLQMHYPCGSVSFKGKYTEQGGHWS